MCLVSQAARSGKLKIRNLIRNLMFVNSKTLQDAE